MFYFYMLRCKDGSFYCGQTKDLNRRVKEHNEGGIKSAKYTRGRTPVLLVYFEKYRLLREAMKREIEVKKWKKSKKENLIRRFK